MSLLIFLLFSSLFVAAGSIIWFSLKNGISPMPTSFKVKKAFLHALPKDLNGTILELGAGWGSLAFSLAKKYPQCSVIAYENSWIPYLFCIIKQLYCRYPNLKFVRRNFFEVSFIQATLIVCYLYPGAMKKLKQKFQEELGKETLIATHTFAIPTFQPIFSLVVEDLYRTTIYHYKNLE